MPRRRRSLDPKVDRIVDTILVAVFIISAAYLVWGIGMGVIAIVRYALTYISEWR